MIRTSITLVALLVILGIASAHSNLGYPLAYSKRSCKASESHTCDGACPPLNGNARNSPQNPADTWRRGQEVEIIWHKNNHIKGFYRRSLVPIKLMKEHKWHKLTAFDYGCWSQGTFRCGNSDKCGGDKTGKAYKNKITVPSVFPDGIYGE